MPFLEPQFITDRYRAFARSWYQGYSTRYERLASDLANDGELVDYVSRLPNGGQPNLFFAAINYVTHGDEFPSDGRSLRRVTGNYASDIERVMQWRRNQTNEVGRCSVLLAALPPGPIALVEVGASAGLCLLLDRFLYEYGDRRCGDPHAAVRLSCAVTGKVATRTNMPDIVWRRGIERYPLELEKEDDCRWLEACIPYDHADRRARLRAALSLARRDPPQIVPGDLADDLHGVICQAPRDACLVVYHSATLVYVSHARRRAFADILRQASLTRDVWWLSNEIDDTLPSTSALDPASGPRVRFKLERTIFRDGTGRRELLAHTHPDGATMTWL
jgi:hypothetical protein